jgi:hypothetical protein
VVEESLFFVFFPKELSGFTSIAKEGYLQQADAIFEAAR